MTLRMHGSYLHLVAGAQQRWVRVGREMLTGVSSASDSFSDGNADAAWRPADRAATR